MRPFTVEFKSKRRPTANLSPSIWGNTAQHFGIAPDRRPDPPRPSLDKLTFAPAPKEAQPEAKVQTKRILPDLRVAEVKVDAEIVAVRVRRTPRKKGGNTMLHDAEKPNEHQMEPTSPVPDQIVTPDPEAQVYQSGSPEADEVPSTALDLPTNSEIEVPQGSHSATSEASIVVPETGNQRSRRWVRGTHELRRGERWKRRLPEVCR